MGPPYYGRHLWALTFVLSRSELSRHSHRDVGSRPRIQEHTQLYRPNARLHAHE